MMFPYPVYYAWCRKGGQAIICQYQQGGVLLMDRETMKIFLFVVSAILLTIIVLLWLGI